MSLMALIRGKRNTDIPRIATATLATLATIPAKTEEIKPSVATVATVAVANKKTAEIVEPQNTEKVSRQPDTTSAYCPSYGGHCSIKITGVYPDDCIKIGCSVPRQENVLTAPAAIKRP